MRFFIWIVLLFAAAIGLAVLAQFNPGNVVLFFPPYRVDLSLNLFVVVLLIAFVVLYAITQTIKLTRDMPRKVADYRRKKFDFEAGKSLRDALRYSLEGRFGHAEKTAQNVLSHAQYAPLAALIAARSAHHMGEYARAEQWLGKFPDDKEFKTARAMTRAELLLEEQSPESALRILSELNAQGVRHIHVLRLALKANQKIQNWPEILRILKTLQRNDAIHESIARRLREMAYLAQFMDPNNDGDSLEKLWTSVPEENRADPGIVLCAAQAFDRKGRGVQAREMLSTALDTNWDKSLLDAYGNISSEESAATVRAQLDHCESWLKERRRDADLLLCLGVLCSKQQLWGKAQRHLESAISQASDIGTKRAAHLRLAELFEQLGNAEQASTHYRAYARCGSADSSTPATI